MYARIRHLIVAIMSCAALVPGLAAGSSSASTPATTTFKGRFICKSEPLTGNGKTMEQGTLNILADNPLAGARVELLGEPRAYSSVVGVHLQDFHVGFTVRGTVYAGANGDWSFTVPQTEDTNYFVQVSLDDGRGTIVSHYPDLAAAAVVPGTGGTNFNNRPVQDYHTQSYPGQECRLWLALKNVNHEYAQLMGKRPPYGTLVAQYDAPTKGTPWTDYTTIEWPSGFPVSRERVRNEFWHTIRNASLGSEAAFLDEVSVGDPMLRRSPCSRTSPQYAFNEGWAEFWAGDFYPAPDCSSGTATDQAIEGDVAWTLTRLAANCAVASPKRMVETLLAQGPKIHSLTDFMAALHVGSASCANTPLDPTAVPRTTIAPPVSGERSIRDLRAQLAALRRWETALAKLLPGVDRASASASCPRQPCSEAIGRKLAPSLIRGQIAQAHAEVALLQSELVIDAQSLRGRPSRRFLEGVTRTPPKLAATMAKIGVHSIDKALAAARPLATRDHSEQTGSELGFFRSQRSSLAQAAPTRGHQYRHARSWGCGWFACWAGWSEGDAKTRAVPTVYVHEIEFSHNSPERTAITFGSASTLSFRRSLPKYVCPARPDFRGYAAVTPTCVASDIAFGSFHYSGMLAKLRFPARSVWADIGAGIATPGGFAAEVDGFDASGVLVAQDAELVGSTTIGGESPYESRLVKLAPDLHAHPIVYVALYINQAVSPVAGVIPELSVFSIGYEEKPR